MQDLFDFSQALILLKESRAVSRVSWPYTDQTKVTVHAQFPDAGSANTEPYLYMVKEKEGSARKRFPLDLSCESLFAEDWYEVA